MKCVGSRGRPRWYHGATWRPWGSAVLRNVDAEGAVGVGRRRQLAKGTGSGPRGAGSWLGRVLADDALAARDPRRLGAFWCAVAGLAFWWPLMRNSVTGFVFSAAAGSAGVASQRALCLFAAVVLAASLLGALGASRTERPRVASWAVPLLGLLSSAANGCALAVPGTAPLVASAVLLALVFVGFSAAWGVWLVRWASGGRETLLLAAASYAASFAVGYLSYLPDPFALVRPLGAPVISGLCWYGCWRLGGRAVEKPARAAGAAAGERSASLGRSLYVLVLVFFLVGSIATGFINTGSVAYVPSAGTFVRDTLSLALSLGLMGLVGLTGRLDRAEFLLVSLLGAVQFAGIFIATFFSESLVAYGAGLMQASKSWFSAALFVLVLEDACEGGAACVRRVLVRFAVPVALSVGISYLAVPALVASLAIAYEGFWGTLSLAMGFFLGVLVFVFLSSMAVRSLPSEDDCQGQADRPAVGESQPTAGVEAAARALGRERGCTAREQDVLALLVAGNTYKRVAELLDVTENTVQYHSKNIYRKFGVHTKQELVDLVARGR